MKREISFILAILMLFAFPLSAKAEENKTIDAKSSILMNLDTGEVIKEHNAYEHLSPASVTKLMSILLILEAIDSGKIKLSDEVAATERPCQRVVLKYGLKSGKK